MYTMATKLEDTCLFFEKLHALYYTRPNIIHLYKKDFMMIRNIISLILLHNFLVVSITNSLLLLLNLNFLSTKTLHRDTQEPSQQDKSNELQEICKEEHNFLLSFNSLQFMFLSLALTFVRRPLLGNTTTITSKKKSQ